MQANSGDGPQTSSRHGEDKTYTVQNVTHRMNLTGPKLCSQLTLCGKIIAIARKYTKKRHHKNNG